MTRQIIRIQTNYNYTSHPTLIVEPTCAQHGYIHFIPPITNLKKIFIIFLQKSTKVAKV